MIKENKGITLIALVITIIVLIILAGISINLLLGDNGIIKKAQEAGIESEKASLVEEIQLKITDKQIGNNGKISKEQVKNILDEYGTTIIENDEITGLRPENKDYIILIGNIGPADVLDNLELRRRTSMGISRR